MFSVIFLVNLLINLDIKHIKESLISQILKCVKYIIVGKGVQNACTIEYTYFYCFSSCFNVDSSFHIKDTFHKFSLIVLCIPIKETASQILYLGPSFCFM